MLWELDKNGNIFQFESNPIESGILKCHKYLIRNNNVILEKEIEFTFNGNTNIVFKMKKSKSRA